MNPIEYMETAPARIPVRTVVDVPASEVLILEACYRRFGLTFIDALRAAWSDYSMMTETPRRRQDRRA